MFKQQLSGDSLIRLIDPHQGFFFIGFENLEEKKKKNQGSHQPYSFSENYLLQKSNKL